MPWPGLPLGGGKAVVLADKTATKTPEMLAAFGRAVEFAWRQICHRRGRRDVVADMIEISKQTKFVAGLPVEGGAVGGDPGPHTSLGVFLGIKAAVKRALGKDSLSGPAHRPAGRGQRRRRRCAAMPRPKAPGCRSPTSIAARAEKLAAETGGTVVDPGRHPVPGGRRGQPHVRWARSSPSRAIAALNTPIVAGGANNQLATPEDGAAAAGARNPLCARLCHQRRRDHQRQSTEYLGDGEAASWSARGSRRFPGRLEQIWAESAATGRDPAAVADAMAQKLIGAWPLAAGGRARDYRHARLRQSRPLPEDRPAGDRRGCWRSGLLLAAAGIIGGLTLTPPDYLQGETVRILYIHVPAAWLGMAGWASIAAASHQPAGLAPSAGRGRRPRHGARRCDLRRAVPRHRIDLGPPDLGHLVGMGRAADLDADPVLPLPRLYRARRRPSASAAGKGGWRRCSGWSGRSTCRSSIIRCCGGGRSTRARSISIASGSSIAPELLWPLPLTMVGFTAIFAAVVLMRMRADLARTEARGAAAPERGGMNQWPFVIAAYALTAARDRGAGPAGRGGRCAGPRPPPSNQTPNDGPPQAPAAGAGCRSRWRRCSARCCSPCGACRTARPISYTPSDIAAASRAGHARCGLAEWSTRVR